MTPYSQLRAFEMVPGSVALWEWAGPQAGILVVGELVDGRPSTKKIPEGVLSGKYLLGNSTWGLSWANGYEPLASLDGNKDGKLMAEELDGIFVWVDANGDAIAQKGEVLQASQYFRELGVVPKDGPDSWIEKGAVLIDGTEVSSWDWWSSSRMPVVDATGETPIPVVLPTYLDREKCQENPAPVIYFWEQPDQKMVGLLRFFKVGDTLFVGTIGPDFPDTHAMAVGEAILEGNKITWGLTNGEQYTVAKLEVDFSGKMSGTVRYGSTAMPMTAFQVVPPFKIPPEAASFFALSDEAFSETVESSFPHVVYIPDGLGGLCFGKTRSLQDLIAQKP